MWKRFVRLKYIFVLFLIVFILGLKISFLVLSDSDICQCNCPDSKAGEVSQDYDKHLLGVVVPFRDRFDELLEFVPHINKFLFNQSLPHKIFIINQMDEYRFNRASLINVGFKVAISEGCDYIAAHDVDLLPRNYNLSYAYPSDGVFHVASPELHPRYHYNTFLGGILLIKKEDFEKVNGMSNRYWGWGLEDDEFYVRIKSNGIPIHRPINITTGTRFTFRHIHNRMRRHRDTAKCYNQKEVTRRRDKETGLDTLDYEIASRQKLTIDGVSADIIMTKLRCNVTATPWCICPANKA